MSSAYVPPTTLDAKYVGTFGSLAALTGAVTAPVIGDTATLTNSAGATGGATGVTRKVFWDGLAWVVFDARQNTSLNSATLFYDASRVAIANTSPSEDNLAGITEYRSSNSISFFVQNGVVQASAVLAGVSLSHTGGPNAPFATITLLTGNAIGYNTMGAATSFTPISITTPMAARYEVIGNFWQGSTAITTTANGYVYLGRAQNGAPSIGGAAQTNSIPIGTTFPASTVATPYVNRNSFSYMGLLAAGSITNVILYQNVIPSYLYSGNLSIGLRQE